MFLTQVGIANSFSEERESLQKPFFVSLIHLLDE